MITYINCLFFNQPPKKGESVGRKPIPVHSMAIDLFKLTGYNDFSFVELTALGESKVIEVTGSSIGNWRNRISKLVSSGYLRKQVITAKRVIYHWEKDLTFAVQEHESAIREESIPKSIFDEMPPWKVSFTKKLYAKFSDHFTFNDVMQLPNLEEYFGVVQNSVATYVGTLFADGVLVGEMQTKSGKAGVRYRIYSWSKAALHCLKDLDSGIQKFEIPAVIRRNGTSRLRVTEAEFELLVQIHEMDKVGLNSDRIVEGNINCHDEDVLEGFLQKMCMAGILEPFGQGNLGRIYKFSQREFDFWQNYIELITEEVLERASLERRLIDLRQERDSQREMKNKVLIAHNKAKSDVKRFEGQLKDLERQLRITRKDLLDAQSRLHITSLDVEPTVQCCDVKIEEIDAQARTLQEQLRSFDSDQSVATAT